MANHQTDGNMAFVHGRTPEPDEPQDNAPSEIQPQGVDEEEKEEEWEPQSLEEALLGE